MQVAGQTQVMYTYDNGDRLTAMSHGPASVAIGYDDTDRRTSLTLPNGIVVDYAYDDDSRIAGLTYRQGMTTLGTLTYDHDARGQRIGVGGTWARAMLPPAVAAATYDDANQIATWNSVSFTYDANGNLTSDGGRSYTWNTRNELTSLAGPTNASFAYDAFGRRRSKTTGATTQFLYDRLNLIQELASGTPTANVLAGLGIDEYFTRTDAVGGRTYLTDALGSTVALADGAGTIHTEYSYEPFGTTVTSGSGTTNSLGFAAREADGTGLYFYRARYFDPKLQRFISEDPLGFGGGDVNLHAYVANDPVNLIDPTGQAIYISRPGCAPPTPGRNPPLGGTRSYAEGVQLACLGRSRWRQAVRGLSPLPPRRQPARQRRRHARPRRQAAGPIRCGASPAQVLLVGDSKD